MNRFLCTAMVVVFAMGTAWADDPVTATTDKPAAEAAEQPATATTEQPAAEEPATATTEEKAASSTTEETTLSPADETAIRQLVEAYVAAFNRGDAKAVAEQWSDLGEYVSSSGERIQGCDAIQKKLEALFADGSKRELKVEIQKLRMTKPDMVVEEGTSRVTRPGMPPNDSGYVATYTKVDGQWKLNSIEEIESELAPTHYEQLKELEWLIGEWVDQDDEMMIDTTCEWTANQNFITRSFTVASKKGVEIRGTQVIGWDPAAQEIRSWMFDSDGAFAEATWRNDGNRWTIRSTSVLSGGEKASSVNIITKIDDDKFTWQSIGREVDGEVLPNIEPVTVVRKKTETPGAQSP